MHDESRLTERQLEYMVNNDVSTKRLRCNMAELQIKNVSNSKLDDLEAVRINQSKLTRCFSGKK